MPTVLGRDVKSTFAARLAGRLYAATLTRQIPGTIDPLDPAHGPTATGVDYACDAIAFGFGETYIDGEKIKMSDFQVTIMLGSIKLANDDAANASLDLATVTADVDTVVEAVEAGVVGNAITVEVVGDSSTSDGSIEQVGTHVELHVQPSATTFAQLELLVATSTIVRVKAASSTPAALVSAGDAFVSVALAGGSDATLSAIDYTPQPGDYVTIPPPGSDTPTTAVVKAIAKLTNVAVTCEVAGFLVDG